MIGKPKGFLFPSPNGGMLSDIRGSLSKAVEGAKIEKRVTLHIFRHTYAAQRLQTTDHGAAVSPYTVMGELGTPPSSSSRTPTATSPALATEAPWWSTGRGRSWARSRELRAREGGDTVTLVLSAGTQDFLVQVSDRRLTNPDTGKAVENLAIKAVSYCNFMVVGYTGVARIAGERTDLWIADQLKQIDNPSCGKASGQLKTAAEEVFRGRRSPPRLVFVALGWHQEPEGSGLNPSLAQISNYHDEDGNRLSEAQASFNVEARYYPSQMFVHAAGIPPSRTDFIWLIRTLQRGLRRSAGQRAVMRLLAHTIRRVADGEPRVGKDLLASCLPREVASTDASGTAWIIKGDPRKTDASFHDLRSGDRGGTRYQPHIVVPRVRITGRLEGPTQQDDSNSVD